MHKDMVIDAVIQHNHSYPLDMALYYNGQILLHLFHENYTCIMHRFQLAVTAIIAGGGYQSPSYAWS